ncbi:MAG: CAP domain-containing protein [Verrucomicrobiota bacterium]
MKNPLLLLLPALALLCTSCSTPMDVTQFSPAEKSLFDAINSLRASNGKAPLNPSSKLTKIARQDAARRGSGDESFVDHVAQSGFLSLATVAGKARTGPSHTGTLINHWKNNATDNQRLTGNFTDIGIGTALFRDGLEYAVILIGSY